MPTSEQPTKTLRAPLSAWIAVVTPVSKVKKFCTVVIAFAPSASKMVVIVLPTPARPPTEVIFPALLHTQHAVTLPRIDR